LLDIRKWLPKLLGNHEGEPPSEPDEIVACSDCFNDQGLKLDAFLIGLDSPSPCPNCGKTSGRKLSRHLLGALAHRFFVWGTLHRCDYGAAPIVQFNHHRATEIDSASWFEADLRLIGQLLGVGFFYYGPRLWMVGEVEPLKALQEPSTRTEIIARILNEYPTTEITSDQLLYRLRRNPQRPDKFDEYDSPPIDLTDSGRLDSKGFPVLYCSQDLQVCIHECRVTAEDELFVATLAPTRKLKVLDFAELLWEENATEFDSLDTAIHMLFLAGSHSYDISRAISLSAHDAGFDGLITHLISACFVPGRCHLRR